LSFLKKFGIIIIKKQKEKRKMAEVNMETVYEVNKKLSLENDKPLDPIALNLKIKEIAEKMSVGDFWMLLCNERRDYTIFDVKKGNQKETEPALRETLQNRGDVVTIFWNDKYQAWEIWVRDINPLTTEKEDYMYLFFDYSSAIVEV
jgi:hypothetical protein